MIQTDVFSAFAIGCALATAAGDGLKATNKRTRTKYFVYLLLLLSHLFLPVKLYMLWEHTGYETLFYYDASMHGIWVAVISFGNLLAGVVGFQVGRALIRRRQELRAYTLWTTANTVVVLITACHYDRFLYPGGIRDWHLEKSYNLVDFFYTEIFKILVGVHILIATPLFYAQIYWPREEGYLTKDRKSSIKYHCAQALLIEGLLAGVFFSLCKLAHLTPDGWGWERLAAILLGQFIYGVFQLIPIFCMSTKYTITTEIAVRRAKSAKPVTTKRGSRKRSHMTNGFASYDSVKEQDNISESSGDTTGSQFEYMTVDTNGVTEVETTTALKDE